jgi:hypothetical protein
LEDSLVILKNIYIILLLGSIPSTGAINPSVLQSILGVSTALRPYWKSMQLRPILTSLPSAPDGSVDVVALRHLYPSLRFDPPVGWPPEVFPTSDYYLVFDKETEQFCATEIAKVGVYYFYKILKICSFNFFYVFVY